MMFRAKARCFLSVWLLSARMVACTPPLVVATPFLRGDPHEQVENSIAHWFQSNPSFVVEQIPLTTTLQQGLEAELRRNPWPFALLTQHPTSRLPSTDQLRFVELGSGDSRWRHFFAPLPSDRWFRSSYGSQIAALQRQPDANLFALFRSSSDHSQSRLVVANMYAVGVIKGIERNIFEEVFRPPIEADDLDVFYLHHVTTHLPDSLQVYFSARHIHP